MVTGESVLELNVPDMINRILFLVGFIAVMGLVSVVFLFIYGHYMFGVTKLQQQLNTIEDKVSRTNALLESILEKLGKPSK